MSDLGHEHDHGGCTCGCPAEGCTRCDGTPNPPPSRATADRIGIEVERDAALADNERLRGIIAETVTHIDENSVDGEDGQSIWVERDDLLAILAKAVRS